MGIIYDDSPEPYHGPPIRYEDMNAVKGFLKHFGNYMYLKFIAEHQETTFQEKQPANKEILIAQRKMDFWKRHPNFSQRAVEQGMKEIRRAWNDGDNECRLRSSYGV